MLRVGSGLLRDDESGYLIEKNLTQKRKYDTCMGLEALLMLMPKEAAPNLHGSALKTVIRRSTRTPRVSSVYPP